MVTSGNLDRFNSRRSTAYHPNGIVATSQPLAASVGRDILKDGGNAFDAAVATAAVLNVVEPTSTGIGGDVFALYRTADGDVGALQSSGHAPKAATIDRVRERAAAEQGVDEADATMPLTGGLTVTVPGTARGWESIADRYGRLPLDTLLEPAIEYARDGYPVTEFIAEKWKHADELFTDDYARDTFLPSGRPPTPGEHIELPDLAATFSTIAADGADGLYDGPLGERIVETVQEAGGLLTMADLREFAVEYPEPISTTYRGVEVFELPPNNQGLVVLEALNIADELAADGVDPSDPERIHQLVESMKAAFTDGHHYITDPEYESVPPLHEKDYARKRASDIGPAATEDVDIGVPNGRSEDADTVLLTVADAAGNVVSFINSLFKGFGSGLVVPGTGIALQNRGRSFSLDPDHPNHIAPGKRPFHTLIPGLARFDADDWMAFGVMGGFMQPQGHLQVITNLVDRGMTEQAALDEPRWRYRADGRVAVEARMDTQTVSTLVRKGHDLTVMSPESFGGGQIARYADGTLIGGTDPRKDGIVSGY
ncbi:Gamma-glutamyltransferase [Halanaeroarchaeum sp. HSR-CO]|uniref:gamma-glutamyltransferase n=1 Tax=Halanaeroarchaeum sp. HSR-CO TaxID=2866382 RepID=UPI00217DB8EC|nr:gamma-glutamyltransferase [Halanaeroarchaeum sp. HSR-CO]UWG46325.1 Gamma-glutamyltransferase [Halanaeroarchaeum sp. HSR-CO]